MSEPNPKTNPFSAADVKSVAEYYDEYIDAPTARVVDELSQAQGQMDRARETLGSSSEFTDESIKALVALGDFGGDSKEAMHRISDLNARCGALRKVANQHTELRTKAARTAPRAADGGYSGPKLTQILMDAAEREGRPRGDFSDQFRATHTSQSLAEHPVMNALFQRVAANPFQRRDAGALSTLRESPEALLGILPMRDVIGVQHTVKYQAKVLDTQAAAIRAEGALAAESAYRWADFNTEVINIATSIPVTDESLDDDPTAEDRVVADLVDELRIRLVREVLSGDAQSGQLVGLLTLHDAVTGTNNDGPRIPNDSSLQSNYGHGFIPTGPGYSQELGHTSASGTFDREDLFDNIREGIGQIEYAGIGSDAQDVGGLLVNRMPTHLVVHPNICQELELTRYGKGGTTANPIREGEYILGGPSSGRYTGMVWGLSQVPMNYELSGAARGSTAGTNVHGLIGAFNSRNIELVVRRDMEFRRGFVNQQFRQFTSTFACQIRMGMVIYDGKSFCRLHTTT